MKYTQNMKEAMVAPVKRFFVNMTNFRVGNIEELLPNPVLCCDSLAVRYFLGPTV